MKKTMSGIKHGLAVAFAMAMVGVASADVTISENMTLTGPLDLRGQGVVTIPAGVTVDLGKWYILCSGLAGDGTITSSSDGFDFTDADATRVSSPSTFYNENTVAPNAFANFTTHTGTQRVMAEIGSAANGGTVTIDYDFRTNVMINAYKVGYASMDGGNAAFQRSPKAWTLYGSLDGTNWRQLDAQSNVTNWQNNRSNPQQNTYYFDNNYLAFRYYRIVFTANNGGALLEFSSLQYGLSWSRRVHVELNNWDPANCNVTFANGTELALADSTLASDYDLTRFGNVCIPKGSTVRLGSHRLKLVSMNGFGTVMNAVSGDVTSTNRPERIWSPTTFGGGTVQNLFNNNTTRNGTDNTRRILVSTANLPVIADFELPGPIPVNRYKIWCGSITNYQQRNPKNWDFYGSNDPAAFGASDDSRWTLLNSQSGITWTAANQAKTYDFANDTGYRFYRMKLKSSSASDWLEAVQLEYLDNHTYTTGTLELAVPQDATIENTQTTLAGDIKLVKSGDGTFKATKGSQSYTGGTDILAGTLMMPRTGAATGAYLGVNNVNTRCQVRIDPGAVFDAGALTGYGWHTVTLNGGTVKVGTIQPNFLLNVTADSLIDGLDSGVNVGSSTGLAPELNGHTLDLKIKLGTELTLRNVTGPGKIQPTAGGWLVFNSAIHPADPAERFDLEPGGVAIKVNDAIDVHDYNTVYNGSYMAGNGSLNVYGTFTPTGNSFFGCTMQDGSTIDLTGKEGPWSTTRSNVNENLQGKDTVTFGAGTVTVNLAGRSPAFGEQIIAWTERPQSTTFVWDATTAAGGVPAVATATGLYYGADPDSTEVAFAQWTGAAGNGDVSDYRNWNCTNPAGREVAEGVPGATTEVRFEGNIAFQYPVGTSLPHQSIVIGDVTLAADCDWRRLGSLKLDGSRINLNGHTLAIQDAQGGTIYGEDYDLTTPTTKMTDITEVSGGTASNLVNNLYTRDNMNNNRRVLVNVDFLPYTCECDFGEAKRVNSYKLYYGPFDNYGRYPRDWKFYGSNDRENWAELDSVEGDEAWAIANNISTAHSRCFDNQTAYRYYRLKVEHCSLRDDLSYELKNHLELHQLELGDTNRTANLVFDVPAGVTNNPTAALLGNVRLVKRGAGALLMTKAYGIAEGYATGAHIEEGTVLQGTSSVNRALGNYGDIVVEAGAEYAIWNSQPSDIYQVVLNGGTIAGRNVDAIHCQPSHILLTADSYWMGDHICGPIARKPSRGVLDLGGHTLTVGYDNGSTGYVFRIVNCDIRNGTVYVPETMSNMDISFSDGASCATNHASVIVGCNFRMGTTSTFDNLEILSSSVANADMNKVGSVYGVFKPHTQAIPNVKLMKDATLDLSAWEGAYSENSTVSNYKLTFENNAEIKVALGNRRVHGEEQLVSWATPPAGVTFVPASRQAPCRFEVRDDGLYTVIRNTIILIR